MQAEGEQHRPVASTLFGGLTHSKTSALNTVLALPPLTSDSSFILPLGKAGERVRPFATLVGRVSVLKSTRILFALQGYHGNKPNLNVSYTSEQDSGVELEGELSVWSEVDLKQPPAPHTWDVEW